MRAPRYATRTALPSPAMAVLEQLGAADLRAIMAAYRDALRQHQTALNRLNVYPVPDGDTGTNMALTLESVLEEVEGADDDMVSTCKALSHGSLMGARGNSGVILSQVLRGLAEVFRDHDEVGPAEMNTALTTAAESAYQAVMKPVEGTILTVIRESAAAGAALDAPTMLDLLEVTRDEAGASLSRTPDLLPVLAEAGVVDAGGAGFVLFLDALLHIVDGRPVPEAVEGEGVIGSDPHLVDPAVVRSGSDHGQGDVSDLRYEVMYFLEAPDETVPAFKDVWAGIGDSIVIVGGDGIWNCHIHTDDIGAAIEAAVEVGRPRDIRVTDLLDQVEEEKWVREAGTEGPFEVADREPVPTAVVAVSTGHGIKRIFHSLGVRGVVTGGQTMNPSTQQLLEAVEAAPADEVVILPNNKNIIAVAEQVDSQSDKTVRVVPTRSITEGFASLIEYDPEASADENAAVMNAASKSVVSGEVCQAVRDSTSEVGPIAEGEWMGMGPGGVRSVNADLGEAGIRLLDALVGDEHEVVTIIEGEGATDGLTRHLTVWLEEHRPDVSTEIHHGGQPLYPYLFGVE